MFFVIVRPNIRVFPVVLAGSLQKSSAQHTLRRPWCASSSVFGSFP